MNSAEWLTACKVFAWRDLVEVLLGPVLEGVEEAEEGEEGEVGPAAGREHQLPTLHLSLILGLGR